MNLLHELVKLPTSGIIALVNEKRKYIHIMWVKNVYENLSRNINQIKNKLHPIPELMTDFQDLEIKVLETVSGEIYQRVRATYWMDEYSRNGWTLYKPIRPIRLHPTLVRGKENNKDRFYVRLCNTQGYAFTVGVFDDYRLAMTFKNENYPSKKVEQIILSRNGLSHLYFRDHPGEYKALR